ALARMKGIRLLRRCWVLLLIATAGLLVAGCGSSSPASSPLSTALSYFPKDSPFVMSVQTDPNSPAIKNEEAMTRRLPLASSGEAALTSELAQFGINYDADIRPLFGNPLLV